MTGQILIILLVSGAAVFSQAVKSNVASTATVSKSTINVLNSDTLPGSLLPNFLFQQGSIEGGSVGVKIGGGRGDPHPFVPDDSCGDDIFDGAMDDMRSPQLPYLTQDLWTCDRTPTDIPVYKLEDDQLTVTITPQYGGKVWSLFDKKREKDLLYNNRAHQPANIGALKSWAAGGAEWNWSPGIIGHSAFTESGVFTARLDTELGPVVRVYEFDRYNGTVWQVDMLLHNGSFVSHPRVVNPTDADLRGYWWTCVAVEATPATRIFTPATHVAETSRDPMRDAPWPYFAESIENASFHGYQEAWPTDNSFLGNHQIGDMFLRIPGDDDSISTPYIAHNQAGDDGYVLVHGHPLNGTKFYTWGQSGPGRFMQDFLAGGGKGEGYYTELQVGPAPTQMQNFAVSANSELQWTEWFRGFNGDDSILRASSSKADYDAALDEIETWIRSSDGMPVTATKELDTFFESIANTPPTEILEQGQPWGALEEMLLGKPLVSGLTFSMPSEGTQGYAEAEPWIELLNDGTFSETTLQRLPQSYQTTDRWLKVLETSANKFGTSWLHALHLGIAYTERGDMIKPKKYFLRSMELKPNPIAARCLGVLQSEPEDAWRYLSQAWSLSAGADDSSSMPGFISDAQEEGTRSRVALNLVTELSFFLQEQLWYERMSAFEVSVLRSGATADYSPDAFTTMQIKNLMHASDYSGALTVLGKNCFPTYAKARDDLMNMWNTAVEGVAQQAKGADSAPLTTVELHQARMSNPIPDNIGCQYASEYCMNYW